MIRGLNWTSVCGIALELPETEEQDHIGSAAVRVAGKIFVQLSAEDPTSIVIKLSGSSQDQLVRYDPTTFSVPAHWGKFGWTKVFLLKVEEQTLKEALIESWSMVAPKKLVKQNAELLDTND